MAEKDIAEKTLEAYNDVFADKEMKEKTGKAAPRYPVVTLVLYFGYQKHWKTPRTLYDCLDIPEEQKLYSAGDYD